ncbi:MAG TPA: hypothetical protein VMF90_15015 [Rhizobiaceae bacterium]|nr:hypothetical protein [Rhizobiaceae bacterium]
MVRQPRRRARHRVRGENGKKLRSAFARRIADDEGVLAVDDWIAALAEENPDEAWLQQLTLDEDDEPEWQDWHLYYLDAFEMIRFDRFYGAMGGEGPISYLAISRYAEDHNITGEDLRLFCRFVRAIDAEWLSHVAGKTPKGGK